MSQAYTVRDCSRTTCRSFAEFSPTFVERYTIISVVYSKRGAFAASLMFGPIVTISVQVTFGECKQNGLTS